jgi:Zn-dependent M32 family carboxypeptidase
LLIRKLSHFSSWAECLDRDDYRFFEQVVDGVLYYDSEFSKKIREEKFKSFATVLDAYAERPRPPKRNIDYSVIKRRKDVQKMSTVVSALSSKKGLIPFSEFDLKILKQLFLNTIKE